MRIFFVILAMLALFAAAPGRASELFQAAPIDEVSVHTLPSFTVLETDTTGTLDANWAKGFRLGARYAALAHSGLNTPSIIIFPDWETNPTAEGVNLHVLVQILIDPLPSLPKVRDHDAALVQMPAMTVACYAMRGAYTPAHFMLGLKKIREYLKARNLPAAGAPRYLYYSNNTSWVPSWWQVGEVQVPVAASGGQN